MGSTALLGRTTKRMQLAGTQLGPALTPTPSAAGERGKGGPGSRGRGTGAQGREVPALASPTDTCHQDAPTLGPLSHPTPRNPCGPLCTGMRSSLVDFLFVVVYAFFCFVFFKRQLS